MNEQQSNDFLHGVTLEKILNSLIEQYGWDELGKRIDIRCFNSDPSVKSSLKFLRKTAWARKKVENLYITTQKRKRKKEQSFLYTIAFVESQKYYRVTTSGSMSGKGFVQMGFKLLEHIDWQPGTHVLFDHRLLDFRKVNVSDIQAVRDFHLQNADNIGAGNSAIVVGNGLTELWRDLWEQGEKIVPANAVKIFENVETALHWLCKVQESGAENGHENEK